MYNRYIPNGDGSFRRQSVPSENVPKPRPPEPPQRQDTPPKQAQKKLRVPELDTGELLILLILLLLLKDGGEDNTTLLLAAGIYLFTK